MANQPFVFTPVMLIGLGFCLAAFCLVAALAVILIAPPSQPGINAGLEMLLNALVKIVELVAGVMEARQQRVTPPPIQPPDEQEGHL